VDNAEPPADDVEPPADVAANVQSSEQKQSEKQEKYVYIALVGQEGGETDGCLDDPDELDSMLAFHQHVALHWDFFQLPFEGFAQTANDIVVWKGNQVIAVVRIDGSIVRFDGRPNPAPAYDDDVPTFTLVGGTIVQQLNRSNEN
jgi:hypothetical protein